MLMQLDPYTYYTTFYQMQIVIMLITIIIWIVLGLICAIIVYKDAKQIRGMPAIIWAIIAFIMPIVGLLIYYGIKKAY